MKDLVLENPTHIAPLLDFRVQWQPLHMTGRPSMVLVSQSEPIPSQYAQSKAGSWLWGWDRPYNRPLLPSVKSSLTSQQAP